MIGLINGKLTAVLIALFLGIWVWAWSSKNVEKFNEMANLPLEKEADESGAHDHE